MPELELVRRAQNYGARVAVTSDGQDHSYDSLLSVSEGIAARLLDGSADLDEQRVAFLIPASFEYAAVQWGIWRAGGIAVPLSLSSADPELEHVITDAQVNRIIVPEDSLGKLRPLCDRLSTPLLSVEGISSPQSVALPQLEAQRRAMILYTSGTTSNSVATSIKGLDQCSRRSERVRESSHITATPMSTEIPCFITMR